MGQLFSLFSPTDLPTDVADYMQAEFGLQDMPEKRALIDFGWTELLATLSTLQDYSVDAQWNGQSGQISIQHTREPEVWASLVWPPGATNTDYGFHFSKGTLRAVTDSLKAISRVAGPVIVLPDSSECVAVVDGGACRVYAQSR